MSAFQPVLKVFLSKTIPVLNANLNVNLANLTMNAILVNKGSFYPQINV